MVRKCLVCGSNTATVLSKLFDDRYGASGYFSIAKCQNCGFMSTKPVLKKEEIAKFYAKYYPLNALTISDIRNRVNLKSKFNMWFNGIGNVAHLYVAKKADVLDVGSGSGVSLLEIKKLGANAYGVEPDPNSQRIAKAFGLSVFRGFIADNPFPKMKFGFVTASQVIEHEPKPENFLRAAKKKLKPGGRIILSFPNANSFYRKIFGRNWINWHVPYHINHFSKKSIGLLAGRVGLRVVKIRTITPNLWTKLQLKSLFYKSEMGKPSSIWTNQPYAGSRVIDRFLFLAPFLYIPLNRIIDALGFGDSILVFLEEK